MATPPGRGWLMLLWATAGGSLFAAVLLGASAYGSYSYGRYLDDHGITTDAYVVDVSARTVVVEFATRRGIRTVAEIKWWAAERPAVNDAIEITYDPWDPRDAVRPGSRDDQLAGALFAVGAVYTAGVAAGAAAGAFLVHRSRGQAARGSGG